jgi:hypothetical protein
MKESVLKSRSFASAVRIVNMLKNKDE